MTMKSIPLAIAMSLVLRITVLVATSIISSGKNMINFLNSLSYKNTINHPGLCQQTTLTSCTCPGYEVVFECAVSGGFATIWQGTALANCGDSRISLRHSQFTREGGYTINRTCGSSRTITGQAVSVVNDTYVSQLTITASQELNDSTIECGGGSNIDIKLISLTSSTGTVLKYCMFTCFNDDNYSILCSIVCVPPPKNVTVSDATTNNITFTFTSPNALQNCPAVHYSIVSDNCGHCPNLTTSNSFSCNFDDSTESQECTITIQTLLCDSLFGTSNESITFSVPGWKLLSSVLQ